MLSKDLELSYKFIDSFFVNALPSIFNSASLARIQAIISTFENNFDPRSKMRFMVGLKKDEDNVNNIIFERTEDNEKQNSYVYNINWNGHIIYKSGGLQDD